MAPEAQLNASGQPGLPSSQQAAQQSPPAAVAAPEPLVSEPLSAPQPPEQVQQETQAPGAETRAPQVMQAHGEVLGPQAAIREEPRQPASPWPVARMTQVRRHAAAPRNDRLPVKLRAFSLR